jgi:hypothetical protein
MDETRQSSMVWLLLLYFGCFETLEGLSVQQLLGRRVRGGSGGGERRWLLVPGSEQFSHCFLMASQDSLGTRHLRCLTSIFAGPKCLALWGSPILVGRGHAFAWNRGIEDEHSREQKERHLGLKCGGWANGRATSTLHFHASPRLSTSAI